MGRNRLLDRRIANGVGDGGGFQTGNCDDIAGAGLIDRQALKAAKCQDLGNPALLDGP